MTGNWPRFASMSYSDPKGVLMLDYSRLCQAQERFAALTSRASYAVKLMSELEAGAIANPDEGRMVGHYWLRDSSICPDKGIASEIADTYASLRSFASDVHSGKVKSPSGKPFQSFVLIGIGGSALGPQFISDALAAKCGGMVAHFMDNTDPDGFDRLFACLDASLDAALFIVVSKSGGTAETRNGMVEAKRRLKQAGLSFEGQAVAITQNGSALDRTAETEGWLARFPMWDWVGGRTSLMSAVGLLPALLQGVDTDALLEGARYCDSLGRNPEWESNPSLLMAMSWLIATEGKARRALVVLPYKDRLSLFSKYLQQLVMESLGKETDTKGNKVNQGITVFGNKGSTDQHSYVQQLVEGPDQYLVTFVHVLRDRLGTSPLVDGSNTSGDYLAAFMSGTRDALSQKGRPSMAITVRSADAFDVGLLIALFERAVGFYASMVGINAYHQPGVEAGKLSAGRALVALSEAIGFLSGRRGERYSALEISERIGRKDEAEAIFFMLRHAADNPDRSVRSEGTHPLSMMFWMP